MHKSQLLSEENATGYFSRSPQISPAFPRQVAIRTGRDDARAVRRKAGAAHVGFLMAVQQPSHLEASLTSKMVITWGFKADLLMFEWWLNGI